MKAHNRANLVGKRFGLLTVVRFAETSKNRSRWVCQCDCGGECIAIGHDLSQGKVTSCKCLQKASSRRKAVVMSLGNEIESGKASRNLLYATYKWQAKKKGLPFELSKDEFQVLTSGNCFYCGCEPTRRYLGSTCKTPYFCNGVDRQDNTQGYTLSNCVPCCKICNWMKRVLTVEEFIRACKAVAAHQSELEAQVGCSQAGKAADC